MHISNNMNVNQNIIDEETEELDNNIKDISEESDIKESLEEFLDNLYPEIKYPKIKNAGIDGGIE